jgi:tetratricopeptide (TPR) repeat protein
LEQALEHERAALKRDPQNRQYRVFLKTQFYNMGTVLLSLGQRSEAIKMRREEVEVSTGLVKEFGDEPQLQSDLGAALNDLATALTQQGESREAAQLLERAVNHQRTALAADTKNATYRLFLGRHYMNLAEARQNLGKYEQAAAAWDQMIRAIVPRWQECYGAARGLAECARLAEKDAKLAENKRRELQRTYLDRAMEFLEEAVRLGFNNAEQLRSDPNIEPLRSRDDFQRLQRQIEAKATTPKLKLLQRPARPGGVRAG